MRGWTVRPLEVELQEWLFRLCRRTALHRASFNGKTETAVALVKAGADVNGKDKDGYGFSGRHRDYWLCAPLRSEAFGCWGGEGAGEGRSD